VRGNLDSDNQSLRGFLRLVETEYPEELLRVRQPIDLHFDATALVFELDNAGKSPVVMFDNVRGHSMQLVTNVAANRKLLAACLRVEPGNLPTAFRERCQKYIPCEIVERGAWEDLVFEGDDVDLTKLPIPLQFTVDAAPYITAGQIVARDPMTGVDTTGFHRLMVKGKNRLGVSLHSRRRLYEFHRRAEESGVSLPAAPDRRAFVVFVIFLAAGRTRTSKQILRKAVRVRPPFIVRMGGPWNGTTAAPDASATCRYEFGLDHIGSFSSVAVRRCSKS